MIKKNKILFVATVTKHIVGFHLPYLKLFKELGYEVHIASNGIEKIEYCDKHFNLPFERFPFKKENLKVYKKLKKIINENNYEIIHCHTPVGGVLARLAARKSRKNGTKVIYTAHGFHFYKGAPLFNWLIYYPIEKFMAKYTDCLITINNEDYEFAKKHLKIKRIELIHGVGMNTCRFEKKLSANQKTEKRKEFNINNEDIVLTYVAELNKNKNQILLINVIEKLKINQPNIRLLLVGDGCYKNVYQKTVKSRNLEKNIKILGQRKDINEILSITDIYVASSIREGLGLNVIEAMYKGLPVIATNNRGHRQLIEDNKNGYLVEIDNEKQLREKIQILINDKKTIKQFKLEGQKNIEPYKLENVIKEMENIYKTIINQ